MRRKPKDKSRLIITSMIVVMVLGSVVWASRDYPGYKVNAYIHAINNEKFEEAYALIYKDEYFSHISKEEYIYFLQTYFNQDNFVKMKKGKQLDNGQAYNVQYIFKDQTFNQVLAITKYKNEWYIQNPFSVQAIVQDKPIELKVTVSQIDTQEQTHQNQMHQEADNTQQVKGQQESIETFINRFYKDYTVGITEKDKHFLERYISEDKIQQVMNDYESWYIADKNVKDAKLRVELERIQEQVNGEVEIDLVEIVQLKNAENKDGQESEKLYKVVTTWKIKMVTCGNSYKISQKDLKESVISYQDDNKQWIAY